MTFVRPSSLPEPPPEKYQQRYELLKSFNSTVTVLLRRQYLASYWNIDANLLHSTDSLSWLAVFHEHPHLHRAVRACLKQLGINYLTLSQPEIKDTLLKIPTPMFMQKLSDFAPPDHHFDKFAHLYDVDQATTPASENPVPGHDVDPEVHLPTTTSCEPEANVSTAVPKNAVEHQLSDLAPTTLTSVGELVSATIASVLDCEADQCEPKTAVNVVAPFQGNSTRPVCGKTSLVWAVKPHHLPAIFRPLGRTIPFVLYAPPGSGKTTYCTMSPFRCDETASSACWGPYVGIVVTNIHELVFSAHCSVAILPSEPVFRSRCEQRGLKVDPHWYRALDAACSHATLRIDSDLFVSHHADEIAMYALSARG